MYRYYLKSDNVSDSMCIEKKTFYKQIDKNEMFNLEVKSLEKYCISGVLGLQEVNTKNEVTEKYFATVINEPITKPIDITINCNVEDKPKSRKKKEVSDAE